MTVPAPSGTLPPGLVVALDPAVQRREDGAVLVGGSPLRQLRLSAAARAMLDGDRLTVTDARTAGLAGRLLDTGLAHPQVEPVRPAEVTVVVPAKDRTEGLARLLAALRTDPGTADLPVLVVDDGSTDPAAVAAAAAGARVLRRERSGGPAAARNTGLRAADTPLVAFLDSDVVPEPGWLDRLAGHLVDPRLALVAPRITALPGSGASGWVARYEALSSALDMGDRCALVHPRSALPYVPSAALLARRVALGAGFDESLQVGEDVDLVWRTIGAGWRVRYEPAARVAHEHRVQPREFLARRAFYGSSAAQLAQRHGALVSPVVISPWSAAALALAGTGRPLGLLGAGAVLGEATRRLAARVAAPDGARPWRWSAGLVLRGTAGAARMLARTVTRHHWPLALAAGLVSRRARRGVLAVAVADAVLAWWPHRSEVDLPAFAAGRRLEDLAYGAGLWSGALRAGSVRALLPAAPEPVSPQA
ncbi:mycofactocin biosynthesis glycosyltransferase MftF [uncultured Modestobacter sp.]|uniref:mycofactocin biosynthesis glycosyltransferase MftF n=1 Tax=uncultured Modestobacter sp. TaxID=380048 RepID=UPI00261E8CFF|nr:mycofactocin biosynthesis glycosyltransferase MftF [uncultured Modestobacter sp.]